MVPLDTSLFVDAVAKATLCLGLSAMAALVLRRASAASRHFVWTLGVAAALLLPTAQALAPRWELPLLPSLAKAAPAASPAVRAPSGDPVTTHSAVPAANDDRQAPLATAPPARVDPRQLLIAAWLLGVVALGAPFVAGALHTTWRHHRSLPLSSGPWPALVAEVSTALDLPRPVRLLRGGPGSMPMATGLVNPVVMMPEEAEQWPEARRRAVLTHELAHVKRHDCLVQFLAHAACVVYWFNPLAWLAARRLRVERERACDDLVLRSGASGPDYADDLLHLARHARAVRLSWGTVAVARPSQLEGRLIAILDPSLDRRGPSRPAAGATAVAAAALLIPLAGLQPWERPVHAAPTARATATGETEADAEADRSSDRVAAALAEALRDSDDEVRKHAVFSLGQIGQKTTAPALAGALADKDAEVRAQAAFALGQIRSDQSVGALAEALRDPEAEVRQQAAFALGQIRDPSAVPALSAALQDADAEVRQQVVFALGQLHAEGAASALTKALKDENEEVREQAAFALGQISSREAVPALLESLEDASAEVRQQAAFALGQIGDPAATDALAAALKDPEAEVRRQAAFALGQLVE